MKLLLVNFAECPENLHFERALARAAARRRGLRLDVVHDFDFPYSFLGAPELPGGGRRLKYSGLPALKRAAAAADIILLLDFPKRARCAAAYLWLLRQAAGAEKYFIANHLIPMPGQNITADLARRWRALSAVKAGYMLESDDLSLWAAAGLDGARLLRRGYASDCEYYKPAGAAAGGYVFSAGSAGRDFKALALGAAQAGLPLKVFTDSKPGRLPAGAELLPLAKNLHNLREAAGKAAAVVIPVSDGYKNEAAGNSIAFLSMAMGRPVLTRRTPYMERFIKDGVNGFFYASLSAGSVARGLNRVKAMPPARLRALGAAARRTVLAGANLDAFCRALLGKIASRRIC